MKASRAGSARPVPIVAISGLNSRGDNRSQHSEAAQHSHRRTVPKNERSERYAE